MPEDSKIDRQIAAILTGSGLPVERRAEVAEELRGHLEARVADHREAGLDEGQAVEAALGEFGSPDVIRKHLRRQQRMLDRRRALGEIRRSPWTIAVGVGLTGIYAAVIAVLHPVPGSLLARCVWGLVLFAAFALMLLLPMYWAALFGCVLQRQRPREEYHVLRSFLRGMAMGGVFLAYMLIWAALWVIPVVPLLFKAPEFAHYLPGAFVQNYAVAVVESAGRIVALLAAGMFGFGLGVTLYERSRCVDRQIAGVRYR